MSDSPSTTPPLQHIEPSNDGQDQEEMAKRASRHMAPRRRRTLVRAACQACKRRKTKCDAARPACSPCIERRVECAYDTEGDERPSQAIKRKYTDLLLANEGYEELLGILRFRPQQVVDAVTSRIRSGEDVLSIVRHVKDGDLLLQLSLVPDDWYRYELPHIDEMLSNFRYPGNPYAKSLLLHGVSRPSLPRKSQKRADDRRGPPRLDQDNPYLIPYHAAELADSLVNSVRPSQWTSLSLDDGLLRELLKAYFLYEFPYFQIFHKDLFLQDMQHGRGNFCSELLVNTVLAAACRGYNKLSKRAEFWNPDTLGYKFLAESRRLWELDMRPQLTTIQAGVVLTQLLGKDGLDRIGWQYLQQAIDMAKQLCLFDESSNDYSDKMNIVRTVTAWGIFNFQGLCCFHLCLAPMIDTPPKACLPSLSTTDFWNDDIWLEYPFSRTLLPQYLGLTFKATCEFRVILNDMTARSHGQSNPGKSLTVQEALEFYYRFKRWYIALPEPLKAANVVYPVHLKLHLNYHIVLICLSETFSDAQSTDERSSDTTIRDILESETTAFRSILYLYYLRHGFESYDSFMLQFLSNLGNGAIKNIAKAPAATKAEVIRAQRPSLLLAAKGIYDQGHCFFLAKVRFRVFKEEVEAEDPNLLKDFGGVDSEEDERPILMEHIRKQCMWPVNLIALTQEGDERRLENLIFTYRKLRLDTESLSART